MICVTVLAAPFARVVVYTMLVVTSSSSGVRLGAEDAEDEARLKSDVMFRYGGKKSEEKLGNMLLNVKLLEREVEVEVEEEVLE